MTELYLKSGKGEFVRRKLPSGEIREVCLCNLNADFSKACIGQVHGTLLTEVVENDGQYQKGNLEKYRGEGRLDNRCKYCYAKRKNWGKVTPKIIGAQVRREFMEKRPSVIRIGKSTECGHYFYEKELIGFLKLCREFGTKTIFPTKMLKFSREISDLLIKTNSVVNYSICNDKLEEGAESQGYTNSWRISQAEEYARNGVNTTLTLTCDVTQSFLENARRGFTIDEIFEAEQRGMKIRLLPMRLNSKELVKNVTGKQTGELVRPTEYGDLLDFEISWRYLRRPNNELVPLFFHQDFQKLVNKEIGICERVGDYEHCDKCNLKEGVRIRFPVKELVKIR